MSITRQDQSRKFSIHISEKYTFYNNYIEQDTLSVNVVKSIATKSYQKALKCMFGGFSIFFIALFVFILVYDAMTVESSNKEECCTKYGFLASPDC